MNLQIGENEIKRFSEPAVRYPFCVEQCGIEYCSTHYHIIRSIVTSNVYVAEYVISGKGTLLVNGEEYHPGEGDFYLLQPGIPHEYYSDPADPWLKMHINCYGVLCESLISAYGLSNTVLVPSCNVLAEFEELFRIAKENRPTEEIMACCAGRFTELIAMVSAIRMQGKSRTDNTEVNMLCDYLDHNMHRIVSISELSGVIFRSPDYTIKLFKREIGSTPYDYQLTQKLNIAMRMLCNSESSVSSIAQSLGFDDPQHFSKLFRKKCGTSPRNYRNQFRQAKTDHEPWLSRPTPHDA